MTATAPAGGSRGWTPSAYQAAVALSGLSALLGLGRELLVFQRLRFGEANDTLQFALSITYTISLLSEPLRLAALNLLSRQVGWRLTGTLGAGVLAAAALTTAGFSGGGRGLPTEWLLMAGAAGAANLVLAWVLPRMQRGGPFLPVHAVTVMPNVLIVLGMLLPAASTTSFSARVVSLFLLAPLAQLVCLALLRRFADHPPLAPPPTVLEGIRPMGWHAAGAAAGQGAQYFLRTALLAAGTGLLSRFVLVLRVSETLRAVFVDTYIASRIRRWAAGERTSSGAVDGRWLGAVPLAGIVAAGLVVALVWPAPGSAWPAAIELGLGTYLVLALRVRYQSANTGAPPLALTRRMAWLEGSTALLTAGLSRSALAPVALLPWAIYVAKPAVGLRLVDVGAAAPVVPAAEA